MVQLLCDEHLEIWNDLEKGTYNGWSASGDSVLKRLTTSAELQSPWELSSMNRLEWYWGMTKKLDKIGCMKIGNIYEINAKMRLVTTDGVETCDPFQIHLDKRSCPTISLITIGGDRPLGNIEIATVVGPYKNDDWNGMYGIFKVTEEMVSAQSIQIHISKAWKNVDIIVDISTITIKLATPETYGLTSCSTNLIKNWGAEIGDARFWKIVGSGSIQLSRGGVQPSSKWSIRHVDRTRSSDGLFQFIDQSCLTVGSFWQIQAIIKLVSARGEAFQCDINASTGEYTCPIIGLMMMKGNSRNYLHVHNSVKLAWKDGAYNEFRGYLEVDQQIASFDKVGVFVQRVKGDVDVIVDSISMIPLTDDISSRPLSTSVGQY
eukprot:CAMPEP_0171294862 /NCGR_PEP_ID=MMETSP0816-20121228/3364_1 /TAXON_ID=420281 /ORGANISM="Proboscia inermis, Strain CCAP1064/1" /LENGTH=375 /DNA_ID=CAMNT_0011767013 /DNA_START=62 /DNA_END=1189 /DNA_ORIENTATION=-